jgi:sucrose-6F-phosphate phosphohydrolase
MQYLLATDLDNTLVGDDEALELLNQWLTEIRARQQLILVYSTGRSLHSYQQLCQEVSLLTPDILVTAVGTEIYHGDSALPDNQWSNCLQPQWDLDLVKQTTSHFTDLRPQPDSEQRPFKVSFFLEPVNADAVLAELSTALQEAGLLTQLVYSGGKDLDILPQAANKGKALQFLQTQFGIADPQTIACGDSGNDIALFGHNRGIIVGNAQSELLDWYQQNPAPHHYLASNHYAAGISEGLQHFGVGLEYWA